MLKSILKLLGLVVLYVLGIGIFLINFASFRYLIPSILLPAVYAIALLLGSYFYTKKIAPIAQLTILQSKIVKVVLLVVGAVSIFSSIMLVVVISMIVGGLGGSSEEVNSLEFLLIVLLPFNFIFNLLSYKSFSIDISTIRVTAYLLILQILLYAVYYLFSFF